MFRCTAERSRYISGLRILSHLASKLGISALESIAGQARQTAAWELHLFCRSMAGRAALAMVHRQQAIVPMLQPRGASARLLHYSTQVQLQSSRMIPPSSESCVERGTGVSLGASCLLLPACQMQSICAQPYTAHRTC